MTRATIALLACVLLPATASANCKVQKEKNDAAQVALAAYLKHVRAGNPEEPDFLERVYAFYDKYEECLATLTPGTGGFTRPPPVKQTPRK